MSNICHTHRFCNIIGWSPKQRGFINDIFTLVFYNKIKKKNSILNYNTIYIHMSNDIFNLTHLHVTLEYQLGI